MQMTLDFPGHKINLFPSMNIGLFYCLSSSEIKNIVIRKSLLNDL